MPIGEELLRLVFESAPTAKLMVSADGTIRLVNREAEALFGYESRELLGCSIDMLVPTRSRGAHPGLRAAFFAALQPRNVGVGRDLYGLRKDGREVPIEIGLKPIHTADGEFVLAVVIDLTERKQLEASLRDSETRMRAVIEAAPNAMIMIAEDGRVVLVNAQAERLFGWSRQELLGQPIEVLVPERFRGRHPGQRGSFFAAPIARPMGAGRDLHGLRRDGSEVAIEIGLNPIATDEGPCVLAAIIDITQRQRTEALLRASLQEKDNLLREVHHRVKNNMQLVSSMLNLQTEHVDDARARAQLQECRSRVHSIALVHEKLYLAPNFATIDVGDYVRELAAMLARSFGAAQVQVVVRTDPIVFAIDTAIPLGLILNELVTNAFKHGFADGRTGTLTIALERRADGWIELRVADDGRGLAAGAVLDGSRSLGLRIVHNLVRQLDATFAVERGPGTSFCIAFPANGAGIGATT